MSLIASTSQEVYEHLISLGKKNSYRAWNNDVKSSELMFSDREFKNLSFSRFNFSNITFQNCTFNNIDLSKSVMENTNCINSFFENVNLFQSNFISANLHNVRFIDVNMEKSNFSYSNFSIQCFKDVKYRDLNLVDAAIKTEVMDIDFSQVKTSLMDKINLLEKTIKNDALIMNNKEIITLKNKLLYWKTKYNLKKLKDSGYFNKSAKLSKQYDYNIIEFQLASIYDSHKDSSEFTEKIDSFHKRVIKNRKNFLYIRKLFGKLLKLLLGKQ